MTGENLLARDLLARVYNTFQEEECAYSIFLPEEAKAVIANQSNGRYNYYGYSVYRFVTIFSKNSTRWAVAFGAKDNTACTSIYNCDIAAVKVEEDERVEERIITEIKVKLKDNDYFKKSLICATADGHLFANTSGVFEDRVADNLEVLVKEYTAEQIRENSRENNLYRISTPVLSKIEYRQDFVGPLYRALYNAL